jgi:hypothetical protein
MRPFTRLALITAACTLAGCSTMKSLTDTKSTPEISRLSVTPRRLHPGQNGLAMTQTRNAPSTDYKIVFSATLGSIKPSPDGTSATFTAGPDAGNAIITAQLLDKSGASISQEEAKVLILPVR